MPADQPVLIVGAGPMAVAYFKVLEALGRKAIVLGRGEGSARAFEEQTGQRAGTGALSDQLTRLEEPVATAIVAVNVDQFQSVTEALTSSGIQHILLEKPGGATVADVERMAAMPGASSVYVGYNRRFLPSAMTARRMIEEDGGLTSFLFEFNENIPLVETLTQHTDVVKRHWFFANSTHVVDLAFHLAGASGDLDQLSYSPSVSGPAGTPPRQSYAGAGTISGVPFAYHADWRSAGRWGLELCTAKRRLILKPLEKLFSMPSGSFAMAEEQLGFAEPEGLKPGLFNMVQAFVSGERDGFIPIAEQARRLAAFAPMGGLDEQ